MATLNKTHWIVARKELTRERAAKVLSYDPETGVIRWITARKGPAKKGSVAGAVRKSGYVAIGLFGVDYLAHHIAWLFMTGSLPTQDIDHKDGVGVNNKWKNLRTATKSQNLCNQKLSTRSTTGLKGVSFFKRTGRYRATIQINKVQFHLGYYATAEEAYDTYCDAATKLHGKFKRFE